MRDTKLQGLQPSLHGNLLHLRGRELLDCGLVVPIITLRVCEEEGVRGRGEGWGEGVREWRKGWGGEENRRKVGEREKTICHWTVI